MPDRFTLIHVPGNQELADEFKSNVDFYMRDLQNWNWHDTQKDAWAHDSIGGKREEYNFRISANTKLGKIPFDKFKKARAAEIANKLNDALSDEEKQSLLNEQNLLNSSSTWIDFGSKMETYENAKRKGNVFLSDTHDRDNKSDIAPSVVMATVSTFTAPIFAPYTINVALDTYQNEKHNMPQINWMLEKAKPLLEGRYEMMQSVNYKLAAHEELPDTLFDNKASHFKKLVENGLIHYKNHKDDGKYFTSTGRKEYQDQLSFSHIRKYAHQANGLSKAYDDAVDAMHHSSEWDKICAYYIDKAQKENDTAAMSAWKNINNLRAYARDKGLLQKVYADSLYSVGVDKDHLKNLVVPALNKLSESEQFYTFLANSVNEYAAYARAHPQEIEKQEEEAKKAGKIDEKMATLDYSGVHDKEALLHKTMLSQMDLMFSKSEYQEAAVTALKNAAVVGTFFIPGVGWAAGLAVAAGTGVALEGVDLATAYYGGYKKLSDEEQKEIRAQLADKCALERRLTEAELGKDKRNEVFGDGAWFTSIKNSHLTQDCKNYAQECHQDEMEAKNRLSQMNNDELKAALAWAVHSGSTSGKPVFEMVQGCFDLADMTEEGRAQYIANHEKAMTSAIAAKDVSPELKQEDDVIKVYKSGLYLYGSEQLLSAMAGKNPLAEKRAKLYQDFNGEEAEAMKTLEKAMMESNAVVSEANLRKQLIDKWKMAGKPKVNNEENEENAEGTLLQTLSKSADGPTTKDTLEKNAQTRESEELFDEEGIPKAFQDVNLFNDDYYR